MVLNKTLTYSLSECQAQPRDHRPTRDILTLSILAAVFPPPHSQCEVLHLCAVQFVPYFYFICSEEETFTEFTSVHFNRVWVFEILSLNDNALVAILLLHLFIPSHLLSIGYQFLFATIGLLFVDIIYLVDVLFIIVL